MLNYCLVSAVNGDILPIQHGIIYRVRMATDHNGWINNAAENMHCKVAVTIVIDIDILSANLFRSVIILVVIRIIKESKLCGFR